MTIDMDTYLTKQNVIIGSIILIILSYLGYSSLKEKNLLPLFNSNGSVNGSKNILNNLNITEDTNFISKFSKEIKRATKNIYKLNLRSSETPEQLSIKNNLFHRDFNKKRITIDSRNIHNIKGYNTSNYTIDLLNKGGIKGGTIGRITNIINFKLISCIIPLSPWNVTENNYKIIVHFNGIDNTIELTKNKLYTNTELGLELKTKLSSLDSNFDVIYNLSKFTISSTSTFSFKWKTNYDLNKSSAYRLFGFEMRDYTYANSFTSDVIPDSIEYYVDLVIPEISPKNTIDNLTSNNIIQRIPLNPYNQNMVVYNNINISNYDHFFPISLDKITIQLYDTSGNQFYQCGNKDNSFEFEYIELVNTSLIQKTKI